MRDMQVVKRKKEEAVKREDNRKKVGLDLGIKI
jgi:hypothetical protein